MVSKRVPVENVLRERSSERAAADDDDVERARTGALCARYRLVEAVAHVAAEHVAAEIGVLSSGARHQPLLSCDPDISKLLAGRRSRDRTSSAGRGRGSGLTLSLG